MKRVKLAYVACLLYAGVTVGLLLNPRQVREEPRPIPPGSYVVNPSEAPTIPPPPPLAERDADEGTAF